MAKNNSNDENPKKGSPNSEQEHTTKREIPNQNDGSTVERNYSDKGSLNEGYKPTKDDTNPAPPQDSGTGATTNDGE